MHKGRRAHAFLQRRDAPSYVPISHGNECRVQACCPAEHYDECASGEAARFCQQRRTRVRNSAYEL